MDDLEAFLAGIEQTAPQEPEAAGLRCSECNYSLEQLDDAFVCPNCNTQASNVLMTEESEVHLLSAGLSQLHRISVKKKKKSHLVDYGWAWSTDEAIVKVLVKQVTILEEYRLVPNFFRDGVMKFWLRYWSLFIAPYVQDSYKESDFIPVETHKALKCRDIDVLVKVQDRVMIPDRVARKQPRWAYKYLGIKFSKGHSELNNDHVDEIDLLSMNSADIVEDSNTKDLLNTNRDINNETNSGQDIEMNCESTRDTYTPVILDEIDITDSNHLDENFKNITKSMSINNVVVLTLSRTLAILEACARSLNLILFASDLVRLANQRVIPFYGAHKELPDYMKMNYKDRLMFHRTRSPTPSQLTRAASLLLRRVYEKKIPFKLPIPPLDQILIRFIVDLNLPRSLLPLILEYKTFQSFDQTRPLEFTLNQRCSKYIPHYDRWAFAILVSFILKHFPMTDEELTNVSNKMFANQEKSNMTGSRNLISLFNYKDWFRQLSARLDVVTSYDPYILLHPMIDCSKVETTPQLFNLMLKIVKDQVETSTRIIGPAEMFDDDFRRDLSQFMTENLPLPGGISRKEIHNVQKLSKPKNLNHPLIDSFQRTRKLWSRKYNQDSEMHKLIDRDFKETKLCFEKKTQFSFNLPSGKSSYQINEEWPESFKLLLAVGGFLCYCNPKDILIELSSVHKCRGRKATSDSPMNILDGIDWI